MRIAFFRRRTLQVANTLHRNRTMAQQVPIDKDAELIGDQDDGVTEIVPDVAYRRLAIVNVVYVGTPAPDSDGWVLVDAGVGGTAELILSGGESRFGDM